MATRAGAVVIGGGIAGVSVAHELAAHMDVVLLEQEEQLAHHTTGRSAAAYLETYGPPAVRRLTLASRSFLGPLLSPRPLLWIGARERADELRAAAEVGRALVPSVQLIDATAASELCPALGASQAPVAVLEPDAMDIDVAALHQTYVRGMRGLSGEIHRSSPSLNSGKPLFHGWCDVVARLAGVPTIGLQPLRRTAFTCPAPEGHDVRAWPLVADIDDRFYFKPEGSQLLCSLADETPSPPCDAVAEPLDVALAIERINAATTLELRHVRRAWAGLRSFVADRNPVVGLDPEAPGFCWLAGQGGYGIQTAPAMARAAAGLVVDRRLPDDLIRLGITAADLSPARCR